MIDDVIKEYVDSLHKKLDALRQLLSNDIENFNNDDKLKEKNFFQKLLMFVSGKSKEYEITKQTIINEHEEKVRKTEEEIQKLEIDIEKMQDRDTIIYTLYKERIELFKNPIFMESLIENDPKYIIYDMTNQDEVYNVFARKILSIYGDEMSEYDKEQYNVLISELDNPRIPEDGKYKIPHMFLFEGIKKNIMNNLNNNQKVFSDISFGGYFSNDCKYPLSYGKKIEELYLNNSNYLYYAGINDPNDAFLEGYQVNYGTDLSRNFWEAHTINGDFSSLLFPGKYGRNYTIFAAVPKDAKNILGSDGGVGQYGETIDFETEKRHTYLLPEYIVGAAGIKNGEAIFIENPLKLDERKKYANYGEADVNSFKYSDDTLSEIVNSGKSR